MKKLYLRIKGGKLKYQIVAKSGDTLTLEDPHTLEHFKLPDYKNLMVLAGYEIVRQK